MKTTILRCQANTIETYIIWSFEQTVDDFVNSLNIINLQKLWKKAFKSEWYIDWIYRSPRNEDFLTFEFSFEYRRVKQTAHQVLLHQMRTVEKVSMDLYFETVLLQNQSTGENFAVVSYHIQEVQKFNWKVISTIFNCYTVNSLNKCIVPMITFWII